MLVITGKTGSGSIAVGDAGALFVSLRPGIATPALTPVGRYDAAQLVGTGTITDPPALTLQPVAPFGAATCPQMFFAPSGDLYVASGDLYRYGHAQLSQSGTIANASPEAHFSVTGLAAGAAYVDISGDRDGNLYVCDLESHLVKIAAADLTQSGMVTLAPAMILRAPTTNPNAVFKDSLIH
jgi:hypothetical protein